MPFTNGFLRFAPSIIVCGVFGLFAPDLRGRNWRILKPKTLYLRRTGNSAHTNEAWTDVGYTHIIAQPFQLVKGFWANFPTLYNLHKAQTVDLVGFTKRLISGYVFADQPLEVCPHRLTVCQTAVKSLLDVLVGGVKL